MSVAGVLNLAWMWKCRGEGRAFHRATGAVAPTQSAVLADIIARNQSTDFALRHQFDRVTSPHDFQRRVPLSGYDDYAASIQAIATGATNVLTRERVRLFEPTSGTTRGEKLIPYTRSLAREFQRGISAWIADLMQKRPAVRRGRAYWSISPALGPPRQTAAGIPIGFDDDTAYLGHVERLAAGRLIVAPPPLHPSPHLDNFRYATLRCLLEADDLALISVWSPTFLTTLLAPLDQWAERIVHDLRHGTLSLPCGEASKTSRPPGRTAARARLADRLASIFDNTAPLSEKLRRLWPRLALISCWTDAAAAAYVPDLCRLFPHVEIQPKGLIATEACVSFPLVDRDGAALALRSHFFEFAELSGSEPGAAAGPVRLAHELEVGGRYAVVVTTSGGLYRYQLNDVVEVVGFERACPRLRFVGKGDRVSDLVGEKLAEPHVHDVLDRVFSACGIAPQFSLVVPVAGRPPHYRLYLQANDSRLVEPLADVASAVQAALEENPYYRHAVELGQLAPLDVRHLDGSGESAWRIFERRSVAGGQKPGDVKPAALDARPGWPEEFAPLVVFSQHEVIAESQKK